MLDMLKGKKTFIVAGLGAVIWFLASVGFVSAEDSQKLFEALAIVATVTLRLAIDEVR